MAALPRRGYFAPTTVRGPFESGLLDLIMDQNPAGELPTDKPSPGERSILEN
jgi:hypothetical protein